MNRLMNLLACLFAAWCLLSFVTGSTNAFAQQPGLPQEPEIAAAIKIQQTRHNQQTARLLVKNMAQNFKLSIAQAELLVLMSSGASIAAAQYGARTSADREQTIDTVLAYVFAGLNQIANTRR